jgi:hypothetical protein
MNLAISMKFRVIRLQMYTFQWIPEEWNDDEASESALYHKGNKIKKPHISMRLLDNKR